MKNWNGPRCRAASLHVDGQADTVSPCDTCVEWAWWRPRLLGGYGNYNAVLLEDKKPSEQRSRQ